VRTLLAVTRAEDPAISPSSRRRAAVLAVLRAAQERGYVVSRVKLAKLLYLADLRAVETGGDPVSGVEWKWLDHGPFNTVLFDVEDQLAKDQVIRCTVVPFIGGHEKRLALRHDIDLHLSEDEERIIMDIVRELGDLAASSLRDLSYQTPPMIEARADGRGVVLDLETVRPVPRVGRTLTRLRETARGLPEQFDDEGVEDALVVELAELRHGRARANRLIGGP
jgi:uncharacterized phage-associated protein